MKKLLAVLLAAIMALCSAAFAENTDLIAPQESNSVNIACVRSPFETDEFGNVTGHIYITDDKGNLVEAMTYYQEDNKYTHTMQVYKLASGKYYVETSRTLDGVEHNYMIINATDTGLTVEKHVFDPGETDGMLLQDMLTGQALYEITISEFAGEDQIQQEARNELNQQFSIYGVVFTENGTVVNDGMLVYDLDNLALTTLNELTADQQAKANDLIIGGADATTELLITDEPSTEPSDSKTTAEPTAKPTEKPSSSKETYRSASKGKVTITDSANLRKGPGTGYGVITTISKGTVVTFEGKIGTDARTVDWYKVTYKGHTGYVSSRYSVRGEASVSTSSESKGVVTITGDVHLRAKASKSSDSIRTISAGTKVDYLGKSSTDSRGVKWYKVSYKGDTGWVSSKFAVKGSVSVSSSSSSSSSYVLTTGQVHIRSSYDKDSKDLGTIAEGVKVTYLGSSKKDSRKVRWYKIKYNGTTGWVSSKYAKLVN